MAISESEFIKYIKNNISQGEYFSCVILYESNENLAWYAALRIGEIITDYFKSEIGKQINIHLSLNFARIMPQLNEMKDHDVLFLTTDDQGIKSIASHISTEMLNEKKNIIFLSKDTNPLIQQFIDITNAVIKVNRLNQGEINCIIEISKRGERELKLTQPDTLLINKYHDLKATLLKEAVREQVPELKD
ncbi:hypothetical protein ES705_04549 [subsurface metagenome]